MPTLRAMPRIRGVAWWSVPQGQRPLSRIKYLLQTAPAPSTIMPPLHCTSYRRSHSRTIATRNYSTASLSQQDPVPTTEQDESVKKTSEPLNILFCGSDAFSCASLTALHEEHVRNPALIRSIEVVVRPGKRTGRGLKTVQDPPLRALAESLGLRIHECDTFTGWDLPPQINLIIAVSFGIFVPPRLLHSVLYGGLNLHPSLLPDLRGPAPLHHALLRRRTLTGVSLQTLHPEKFDRGVVLAQTPSDPAAPGALRIPPAATTHHLLGLVKPVAAQMLVRGLRDGLHVPPLVDQGWEARLWRECAPECASETEPESDEGAGGSENEEFSAKRERILRGFGGDNRAAAKPRLVHAPKITTADRQVRPSMLLEDTSSDARPGAEEEEEGKEGGEEEEEEEEDSTIMRRQRVIGPLWFYALDQRDGSKKRIIIEYLQPAPLPTIGTSTSTDTDTTTDTSTEISTTTTIVDKTESQRRSPRSVDADKIKHLLLGLDHPPPSARKEKNRLEIVMFENDEVDTCATLSLATDPAPEGGDGPGAVYLARDCWIKRLKVEGDRAKPPRLALHHFVVVEKPTPKPPKSPKPPKPPKTSKTSKKGS
ncbi:Formyltransferase [Biscogniauxia marginata]|nr:Formyltransferase [Biscogniauxia marginata]